MLFFLLLLGICNGTPNRFKPHPTRLNNFSHTGQFNPFTNQIIGTFVPGGQQECLWGNPCTFQSISGPFSANQLLFCISGSGWSSTTGLVYYWPEAFGGNACSTTFGHFYFNTEWEYHSFPRVCTYCPAVDGYLNPLIV